MNDPAENRELTLTESINQRNPSPEHKARDTGYYLALTFGTLLSSQRADAQQLHPSGLHRQRLVHHTPAPRASRPGGPGRGPCGLVRRIDKVRSVRRPCQTARVV